jgi:hypothetical protein
LRPERGSALLAALVTMTIAALLGSLALRAAATRWSAGARRLAAAGAAVAVQSSLDRLEAQWSPMLADSIPIGATVGLAAAGDTGLRLADSLERLGSGLFLAMSVAQRVGPDGTLFARATGSRLIRLVGPAISTRAVLTSPAATVIGPTAVIDSSDQVPAGAAGLCPPAGGSIGSIGPLEPGEPGRFGSVGLAAILGRQDVAAQGLLPAVGPSLRAGGCDLSDPTNWGDPAGGSACAGYLPVIVAQAGTRVGGGAGQGVLVGLGALELAGDFRFAGVIVSLGPITLRDRVSVLGRVVAADSALVLDEARVQFSRCAVRRAVLGASRPMDLRVSGRYSWP